MQNNVEPSQKIALCFLTYGNLSQPELWSRIINNNTDKLNVYIHNKTDFVDDKYNLGRFCIKDKEGYTRWGHISLVKATLKLFKEAYKNDENNFFVLLSDKCIPLYTFDYIYKQIFRINKNILRFMNGGVGKRYQLLADKSFFSENEIKKQSQWMVLDRKTIKFFIETDYTSKFGDQSRCPDEHYFITIMSKFNISYSNNMVTYFNRDEESDDLVNNKPLPKTYDILTNDMVYSILYDTKCFFMRKVSDKCGLPSYFDSVK